MKLNNNTLIFFLRKKRLLRRIVDTNYNNKIYIFIKYRNAIQSIIGEIRGVIDEDANHLYIARIDVIPSFQKRGIGSCLLNDICQYAKKHHQMKRFRLISHLGAVKFYRKNGFKYLNKKQLNYVRLRKNESIELIKRIY